MTQACLLIEDDPTYAALMAEILQGWAEIVVAHDLTHGLERLKDGNYKCIFLNLNLPDSKGIETLKTVVKAVAEPIPVVVISGDDFDEREIKRAGGTAFVDKSSYKKIKEVMRDHAR